MKKSLKKMQKQRENKLFAICLKDSIGTFAPIEIFADTLADIESVITMEPKQIKGETNDNFEQRRTEHQKVVEELKNGMVVVVKVVQEELLNIKDILQLEE